MLIPGQGRWLATGLVVLAAVSTLGRVSIPAETAGGPSDRAIGRATALQRSEDDDGFSITLVSPGERYLAGMRAIIVEPRLPPGDAIEQVDFFVDGKLACTENEAPYSCQIDFGDEIQRHTIVVSALTRGTRRARVAYVSRSADVSDTAAGAIEVVPAVVRDAAGRPVEGLSVSDFALLEDGVQRPIVHFDSEPAPVSVAVALYAPGHAVPGPQPLLRAVGLLAGALPWHHSLALVSGAPWRPGDAAGPIPAPQRFSFDRDDFARQLRHVATIGAPGMPESSESLAADLAAAARSLHERRGAHALVMMVHAPPTVLGPLPDGRPETFDSAGLGAALESLKAARVTLHAVILDADGQADRFDMLRRAAEESGGEFHVASNPAGAEAACRRISESFLHRYLISYRPETTRRAGWRTIDVRVRRPDLTVQAPAGYTIR